MAGMKARYTEQLVMLETEEIGDLVTGLEEVMKDLNEAVSRADVLRQALAPGLRKLKIRYDGPELNEAIRNARQAREGKARGRRNVEAAGAAAPAG